MAILEDMIEEVLLNLEGYIGDQDVYGTLAANITDTATTFTVNGSVFPDGSGFSTGLVEIGTELVYVQNINRTTGEFSGVLRGFRGTEAQAHLANTGVRNNPRFPRIAVVRAINDTIKSVYPKVYAVKTTEFIINGGVAQYDLPANTLNVISVQILEKGISKTWRRSRRWSFDTTGGSNSATGKVVNIFDAPSSYTVQVTYTAEPSVLDYGDNFATTTGLPEWTRDLIIIGACWRLASFIDSAKVAVMSAEQGLLNQVSPVGAGANVAKQFAGMYQLRLQEVEARIKQEYPAQKHYIR